MELRDWCRVYYGERDADAAHAIIVEALSATECPPGECRCRYVEMTHGRDEHPPLTA